MDLVYLILILLLLTVIGAIITMIIEPILHSITLLISGIFKKERLFLITSLFEIAILSIIWLTVVNSSISFIQDYSNAWYSFLLLILPTILGLMRFLSKWYEYRKNFVENSVLKEGTKTIEKESMGLKKIFLTSVVLLSSIYFSIFGSSENSLLNLLYSFIKSSSIN